MIAGANQLGQPLSLANKSLNGSFIAFDAVGGASLAGPMWYNAMSVIQDYLPNKSFVPPASLGPPPADMPTVPTTAPPTPSSSVSPAPPTDGGGFPDFRRLPRAAAVTLPGQRRRATALTRRYRRASDTALGLTV
ncbi:MAG: hypothetical protein WKF83_17775 [Nocardioidaceae bacterium]